MKNLDNYDSRLAKRDRNKQRAIASKRLQESRIKKLADYRDGKITLCELFKKQRP